MTVHYGAAHHDEAHGTSVHTGGGNWKETYQNGSGDDVEVALGAALTALVSTGAAAAPTMQAVPVKQANARADAQTAAVATVATYTVGAADGTFMVMANVLVTTSTTHNFTVECAYTDESNTARTLTLTFSQISGTLLTAITNVTGAGPYEGIPLCIRAKAATSITIRTQAAGVYTTITFNVDGSIVQVA